MALFVKNQYALVINLIEIDFRITETELQRKGALTYNVRKFVVPVSSRNTKTALVLKIISR